MTEKKQRTNTIVATSMIAAMGQIKLDFSNVHLKFEVKDAGSVTLDLAKLSSEVIAYACAHGLKQRIADAAALSRGEDGKPATGEARLAAMKELVEHYETGTTEWNRKRAGGGAGPSADLRYLRIALLEIYPERSAEQINTWLEKRTKSERAAIMVSEKVKAIIDRERAADAAKVDTDELFMDLETLGD